MELCTRNTAAWRLFNLRYQCLATNLIRVSAHYLEKHVHYQNISGDRNVDNTRNGRFDKTRLTGAAIVSLMAEGHPIQMIDYNECVQLYSDIQEHISDWQGQCGFISHIDQFPPIEELRAFESLALELHQIAMTLRPEKKETSALFERLLNMNRRRNLITTNRWLKDNVVDHSGAIKPYVSMVDSIEMFLAEVANNGG